MTLQAILFDLDGTLIDTNEAHVRSWLAAFETAGHRVGRERLARAIGQGGDVLIGDVLGADVEREAGDFLRRAKAEAYRRELDARGVAFLPRARELLQAAREAGLRTALASSSDDLEVIERPLGVRFADLVDVIVTAKDVETTKPAPDVFLAAASKLGIEALDCAAVGDSLHDASASRRAGSAFIGVETGFATARQLLASGARFVARDAGDLLDRLPRAIRAASRVRAPLDALTLHRMMGEALAEAERGMNEGEAPTGAALFDADGGVVARGHNRARATGDRTAHAEIDALRAATTRRVDLAGGVILAATLEPCVMCLGAAMEMGVDVVLWGLEAPADGGTERVSSPPISPENTLPRCRGGIRSREARELFLHWRRSRATPEQLPYVDQLLRSTARLAEAS